MRGLLITGPASTTWDPDVHYRLDAAVALRPEPFGALAYHYESRRLTFLRSPLLVDVIKALDHHATAAVAVAAMVPRPRQAAFLKALANLATSKFIHADVEAGPDPTGDPVADR